MSMFVLNNLTEANLKELSLSRAKNWITLLEKIEDREEEYSDVLAIEELDKIPAGSDEEQDSDSEGNDVENNEFSFEIESDSYLNFSKIEQNLTVSNAQSILAMISQNPNTTDIINEDREFLEKTLPIFESFNREVREDGFKKLLDTFDEKKIEKNVGKMMHRRIHNETLLCNNYPLRRAYAYNSDTDSDSIDEERYVRSTKKACDYHKHYKMTTTTIKSYSGVKKIRDRTQEMYACDMADRPIKTCQSWAGLQSCQHHSVEERRIAYKSHNFSKNRRLCYDSSSCFEEDDEEAGTHSIKCFGISKKLIPCQRKRCWSSNCCTTLSRHGHQLPKKCTPHTSRNFHFDGLPLMRESDCCCRGTNRLCDQVKHLANSSTEEWLVENYESSEPSEATKLKTNKSKRENCSLREIKRSFVEPIPSKTKKQNYAEDTISSISECGTKNMQNLGNSRKRTKPVGKADKIKHKSSNKASTKSKKGEIKKADYGEDSHESSFERELQLAIQASRDLYEAESKNLQTNSNHSKLISKTEQRKTAKKNVSFQDECTTARFQEQTINKYKKKFVPQLAEISSENECKENQNKENLEKVASKKQKTPHSKYSNTTDFSNTEFKENRKAKSSVTAKTSKTSARTARSSNAKANKKTSTKIKYRNVSYNTVSDSKCSDSQTIQSDNMTACSETSKSVEKSVAYSAIELQKISFCKDSSSDSSTANDTVKTKPTTTTNVTMSENTTFFTNSGQICNSTALLGHNANSRQLLTEKKTEPKNLNHNDTITTRPKAMHSDLPSTSKAAHMRLQTLKKDSPQSDSRDCKRVPSTTHIENSKFSETCRPQIMLYTPKDTTLVPESCFVNDKYHLTLEHLGSIIGLKYAQVFFRYYRGKREFNLTSTVHYIPPKRGYYSGNDTSDDDIDICDMPDIGRIIEEKN